MPVKARLYRLEIMRHNHAIDGERLFFTPS